MKRSSASPLSAPRPLRRYGVLVLVLAVITAGAWLLWSSRAPPRTSDIKLEPRERRTVAQIFQWEPAKQAIADQAAARPTTTGRISPAAVVRALGRVAFDADGKVVVDRNARDVLEDSLQELSNLTTEELEALQRTLRAGLPGPQGDRAAKIVTDYYRYRTTLQDFERSAEAPTTPEGQRTRLNYVAQLRDEYLGPVVARQFYAEDQAMQRYLLESSNAPGAEGAMLQQELQDGVFYLDSRTSPEAQELRQQMSLLRSQGVSDDYAQYVQAQQLGLYTANALPRTDTQRSDWEQRYEQFKQERQLVLTAGLAEVDKQAQLEQLLGQYFNAEELEAIRAYNPR